MLKMQSSDNHLGPWPMLEALVGWIGAPIGLRRSVYRVTIANSDYPQSGDREQVDGAWGAKTVD